MGGINMTPDTNEFVIESGDVLSKDIVVTYKGIPVPVTRMVVSKFWIVKLTEMVNASGNCKNSKK